MQYIESIFKPFLFLKKTRAQKEVFYFTKASRSEEMLIKLLHDSFRKKGIKLKAFIFEDYTHANSFAGIRTRFLRSYYPELMITPLYAPNKHIADMNEYVAQDRYRVCSVAESRYKKKLQKFELYIQLLFQGKPVAAVLLDDNDYAATALIRSVASQNSVKSFKVARWFAPDTFISKNLKLNYFPKVSHCESFSPGRIFKYSSIKKGCPPKNCILFLGGGMDNGSQNPGSPRYWSLGSGWGSDWDMVRAIDKERKQLNLESDLVVRQHPFLANPALKIDQLALDSIGAIHGAEFDLESLIENSALVICGQTTLADASLYIGKKNVCVLGRYFLGWGRVKHIRSVLALRDWMVQSISIIKSNDSTKKAYLELFYKKRVININEPETIEQFIDSLVMKMESPEKPAKLRPKIWLIYFDFQVLCLGALYRLLKLVKREFHNRTNSGIRNSNKISGA